MFCSYRLSVVSVVSVIVVVCFSCVQLYLVHSFCLTLCLSSISTKRIPKKRKKKDDDDDDFTGSHFKRKYTKKDKSAAV